MSGESSWFILTVRVFLKESVEYWVFVFILIEFKALWRLYHTFGTLFSMTSCTHEHLWLWHQCQQSSVNCQNGGVSGELMMCVIMHAEICCDCEWCNVKQGFMCLSIIFGYSVFFYNISKLLSSKNWNYVYWHVGLYFCTYSLCWQ